jgi:hypothetical protein
MGCKVVCARGKTREAFFFPDILYLIIELMIEGAVVSCSRNRTLLNNILPLSPLNYVGTSQQAQHTRAKSA